MKKYFIITFISALLVLAACSSNPGPGDAFAQCLTESGAKMYGAYWCPHCKNQKEEFGSSWQHVNYIECSLPGGRGQTEVCRQAGIEGYPTWEFGDGERISGEVPLETLSEKTGCVLKTGSD